MYAVDIGRGGVEKLFEKTGCYTGGPAWSPDGATIAFNVDCAGGGEIDVWAMNADGSNVRQLTHASGDDSDPTWAPDGSRIAFHSDRGPALYTMKPDGSDQRQVGPIVGFEDAKIAWSQDAKTLLYVSRSGGDLYAVPVDGGKPVQVATGLVSDVSSRR